MIDGQVKPEPFSGIEKASAPVGPPRSLPAAPQELAGPIRKLEEELVVLGAIPKKPAWKEFGLKPKTAGAGGGQRSFFSPQKKRIISQGGLCLALLGAAALLHLSGEAVRAGPRNKFRGLAHALLHGAGALHLGAFLIALWCRFGQVPDSVVLGFCCAVILGLILGIGGSLLVGRGGWLDFFVLLLDLQAAVCLYVFSSNSEDHRGSVYRTRVSAGALSE